MWIQKHFIPNVKDVNFLIYEYTGYTRSDPNFKGVHKEPNEKDICADAGCKN
jgi:hypothetical protein